MKWAYNINNRVKISLLLMVVFTAVFIKNLLEEGNVSDLAGSFTTIYEDRLLPESYIFHLSETLYKKRILIDQSESQQEFMAVKAENKIYNQQIDAILLDFQATLLTKDEAVYLKRLQEDIHSLYALEKELVASQLTVEEFDSAKLNSDQLISQAANKLNKLSEIQLSVGKELNDHSQKIVAGNSILTRFETAILIIMALVINALIFGLVSSRSKIRQKPHLN
ncbi:MCP four helix bundle domain-containing protein [Echinicola marina]|uniref:MCP four helix bundle domain-containing protein n=1 Tax=Echinicola marina TaxID=2859768 RepID=UPI001CF699A4|nr:MCP four helix bundle domain-containing protein [Echinicola marina]UCS92752.1 MCP four helix bundle domain-containing protein [Echinicola marina]